MRAVNSQSFEANDINTGISQRSLLDPTIFLFYINDLPMNILRSLVNTCAGESTTYGYTAKKST